MDKKIWLPAVLGLALAVQGCGSNKARSASEGGYGSTAQTGEPYTDRIAPQPAPLEDSRFDTAAAAERALSTNLIYFDFDDTTIRPEYMGVIETYARYLQDNPSARVRLEGHADERGTREYNLGLGERRALSVESALVSRGVSREQISVVSYGEERPAVSGHDESAWAKNRRVQIIRQ
ncbi:peptidoglycan-associated lipoprotein Pal [Sinimarinibacterium thermocellulolyticum]|uniref:Peptidoglycan-associated lipoprotein n=1 Tax=Sinimarinibacterium thermocellulolyticum TaxID=3170016 RepID=A0ABV2A888_9GAMM